MNSLNNSLSWCRISDIHWAFHFLVWKWWRNSPVVGSILKNLYKMQKAWIATYPFGWSCEGAALGMWSTSWWNNQRESLHEDYKIFNHTHRNSPSRIPPWWAVPRSAPYELASASPSLEILNLDCHKHLWTTPKMNWVHFFVLKSTYVYTIDKVKNIDFIVVTGIEGIHLTINPWIP